MVGTASCWMMHRRLIIRRGERRRGGSREKEEADIMERNQTRMVWIATQKKREDGGKGTRRGKAAGERGCVEVRSG